MVSIPQLRNPPLHILYRQEQQSGSRHSSKLQRLEIPYGMLFDDHSLAEYPQGLMIREWTTHYDGSPVDDDEVLFGKRF